MGNKGFDKGTIIKGKDLKDRVLCKVLSEDMKMRGFQYKMGLNEDINPLELKGSCKAGLHFCDVKSVCNFLCYGSLLAIVEIPDEEDVCVDDGKYRTHRVTIRRVMPLNDVTTWKYLHKNGADITVNDNYAIEWASENGYLEVVKYLHKNGADITVYDNSALCLASLRGHLEVVKYLHKNGADITVDNNYALRYAAKNGHLEVVKYLHENGGSITAYNNYALRHAAIYRHFDVFKYLYENGADISVIDKMFLEELRELENETIEKYAGEPM